MGYKVTYVTVSSNLTLEYRCSKCGKENKVQQTLFDTQTEALSELALDECRKKLIQLQSVNPTLRYKDAGFSCKCGHCGYREPWTWFRQDLIQKAYILWGVLFMLSFIFFAKTQYTFIAVCGWLFRILVIAAAIGTYYLSTHLTEFIAPYIRKLPHSAFPRITIEKTGEEIVPSTMLPPDHWLCMQCGFANPNSQESCSCCNTTKQWSLAQQRKHYPS